MPPLVSILMPVRNGEAFLQDALDSVWRQRCRDFELLVFDNGSTDRTAGILAACPDPRLRVHRTDHPRSISQSMNEGLRTAQGRYLARLDADDICLPTRLQLQTQILDARPELGVCGAWALFFGSGRAYRHCPPTDAEAVRAMFLFQNPLVHSCVMARRSSLLEHGLWYDESLHAAQDLDLWSRCARVFPVANLPRVLMKYRRHAQSVSQERRQSSQQVLLSVLSRELNDLGIQAEPEGLNFHAQVGNASGMRSLDELRRASAWLDHLKSSNDVTKALPAAGLRQAMDWCWSRICCNSAQLGAAVWPLWRERAHSHGPADFRLLAQVLHKSLTQADSPQGRLEMEA